MYLSRAPKPDLVGYDFTKIDKSPIKIYLLTTMHVLDMSIQILPTYHLCLLTDPQYAKAALSSFLIYHRTFAILEA